MTNPRLIQTFLIDGTLEGLRVIEAESMVKALVVPRIKLNEVKSRPESAQPSLYLLISSGENQVYIGEAENFYHRVKNHDQNKDFWDMAVAIVSTTNSLEKSDVKYLESLAVEKAQETAAMEVLNKTIPARNTIHEFKLHQLNIMLEDIALIVGSLGFSLFSSKQEEDSQTWYCKVKNTRAKAQFRGGKFVILAGSIIDKSYAPSWALSWPRSLAERTETLSKLGRDLGSTVELTENAAFKSPNHAGGFAAGRSVNAWGLWKNAEGKTMDEVMRRGE